MISKDQFSINALYTFLFRNRAKQSSLTFVNLVFILMKTMFDCIARILIYSSWMYVTNDGQFDSLKTVQAYYTTIAFLIVFNTFFNDNRDYCRVKTWIGKQSV